MSKRYRFIIIIAVLVICFVFLYPSLSWYFWTPKLDQTRALASRQDIKTYASQTAMLDLQKLIDSARAGGPVPPELVFLVDNAKKYYKDTKTPTPDKWDARAVMVAFNSRQELQSVIETKYRDQIFALKDMQKSAVQLGLDLSGGLSIVLQANVNALQDQLGHPMTPQDQDDAVNRALDVLNSRIDRFGLTEPVIRRQGTDQIYVEIPGSADPEKINSIIMGRGSLAFHMVDQDATDAFNTYYNANPANTFDLQGNLLNPTLIPADTEVLGFYIKDEYGLDEQRINSSGNPDYVVVQKEVGLDGNHIQSAQVSRNSLDGRPEVTFMLDSEGGDIFYKLTSANVGKPLAIVLDDKVKSSAVINSAIRDAVQLTGFAQDEANDIALMLRTAALPVQLDVVNQQSIGASMGEDSIMRGLYSLLGGLAVLLVFMLIYYKGAGVNAVIAQVMNFYIMLSILSAFNFTLTLPSIAGFILTIGMATDANVLVFERMKEELRAGKTRKAAVEAGFEKAFWAIMDSNITTFIVAFFLSQLGTGPIQGFAVSLAIGLFSSVFTSLFVSRFIFDFGTDVMHSKRLSVSWRIR